MVVTPRPMPNLHDSRDRPPSLSRPRSSIEQPLGRNRTQSPGFQVRVLSMHQNLLISSNATRVVATQSEPNYCSFLHLRERRRFIGLGAPLCGCCGSHVSLIALNPPIMSEGWQGLSAEARCSSAGFSYSATSDQRRKRQGFSYCGRLTVQVRCHCLHQCVRGSKPGL